MAVLVFSGGVLLAALFLKDVPLAKEFRDEPGEAGEAIASEADVSMHMM